MENYPDASFNVERKENYLDFIVWVKFTFVLFLT
jgi:hypothetical protein